MVICLQITTLYNGDGSFNGYGIYLRLTDSHRLVILNGGVGWCSSTWVPTPGQTYHVVAVRRSGTWELWINGSQLSTSGNPTPNTPSGNTFVGGRFGGFIDEPAIYNTALSGAQILSHYNAGS